MRVQSAHEHGVALNGDAAVVASATIDHVVRELMLVTPVRSSRAGVDRDHGAWRFSDEHNAVDDQGGRLGEVEHLKLANPGNLETGDVLAIDLVKTAVTLGIVVPGVHEPVVGLGLGVDETFRGDRAERRHDRGVGSWLRVDDRGERAQSENPGY